MPIRIPFSSPLRPSDSSANTSALRTLRADTHTFLLVIWILLILLALDLLVTDLDYSRLYNQGLVEYDSQYSSASSSDRERSFIYSYIWIPRSFRSCVYRCY
jgi:hypothetical protein